MSPQVILNSFPGNTALGGRQFRSFSQLEAGVGGVERKRIHHVKTRTPQILFSISQALVTVCVYPHYLI